MSFLNSHRISIAASLLLLLLGVVFFFFTGRDDAYITYWPAYTLSHFGEILNYNGSRLEQSSSLLLVLLLGISAWVTSIKIPLLGITCSVFFAVLSLFSLRSLSSRIDRDAMPYSLFILAASTYFVYWSFSGMEGTLAAFSIIIFIIAYIDHINSGAVRTSLVVLVSPIPYLMVRPEAVFVLIFFLTAVLAVSAFRMRSSVYYQRVFKKLIPLMISVISFSAMLFLFRYYYFGSLFPLPVAAKMSVGTNSIEKGLSYIAGNFSRPDTLIFGLLLLLSLVMAVYDLIFKRVEEEKVCIMFSISLFVIVYTFFLITSGGDWMEGGRMIVPALPLAAVMVTDLLKRVCFFKKKLLFFILILLLTVLQISGLVSFANKESTGRPIWAVKSAGDYFKDTDFLFSEKVNLVHLRDIPLTLQMDSILTSLQGKYDMKINIMSAQMGMIPYYISIKHYGNIRFMDRASLVDDLFMKCPLTSDIRRGRTGVDLRYSYFFQEKKYLKAECNIPEPDIIFDIGSEQTKHIINNGYTIAYRHAGSVKAHSGNSFKGKINDNQFIAVRDELMQYLDNKSLIWSWKDMKLKEDFE